MEANCVDCNCDMNRTSQLVQLYTYSNLKMHNLSVQEHFNFIQQQLSQLINKCCSLAHLNYTSAEFDRKNLNIEALLQSHEKFTHLLNKWCEFEKQIENSNKRIPKKQLDIPNDIIGHIGTFMHYVDVKKCKRINQDWKNVLTLIETLSITYENNKLKVKKFGNCTNHLEKIHKADSICINFDISNTSKHIEQIIDELEHSNKNIKTLIINFKKSLGLWHIKQLVIKQMALRSIKINYPGWFPIRLHIYNPSNLIHLTSHIELYISKNTCPFQHLVYLYISSIQCDESLNLQNDYQEVLFPSLQHFVIENYSARRLRFQHLNLQYHMQNLIKLSLYLNKLSWELNDDIAFLTKSLNQLECLEFEFLNRLSDPVLYFAMCDEKDKLFNQVRDFEKYARSITNGKIVGLFIYNPSKTLQYLKLSNLDEHFYISSPYLQNIIVNNEFKDFDDDDETTIRSHAPKGFGDQIDLNCDIQLNILSKLTNIRNIGLVKNLKCYNPSVYALKRCENITELCVVYKKLKYHTIFAKHILPMNWLMLRKIVIGMLNDFNCGDKDLMILDLSGCPNLEHIDIDSFDVKLSNHTSYRSLKCLSIKNGYCWNYINKKGEKQFICDDNLFCGLTIFAIIHKTKHYVVDRLNKTFTIIIQNQSELNNIQIISLNAQLNIIINNLNKLTKLNLTHNNEIDYLDVKFHTLPLLRTFHYFIQKTIFQNKQAIISQITNELACWLLTTRKQNILTKLDVICNEKLSIKQFPAIHYQDYSSSYKSKYYISYYHQGSIISVHYKLEDK